MRLLIVVLAIIGISYTQGICSPGCSVCSQGICYMCYQSAFDANTRNCNTQRMVDPQCVLSDQEKVCRMCSPGYAFNINAGKRVNGLEQPAKQCFEHNINNCVLAAYETTSKAAVCGVCNGGYPAPDMLSCQGWTVSFTGLAQPTNNCMWGSITSAEQKNCFRCKKGFSVDSGSCVKSTIEGCLEMRNGACTFCNSWEGYYMSSTGVCKATQTFAEQAGDIKILQTVTEAMRRVFENQ